MEDANGLIYYKYSELIDETKKAVLVSFKLADKIVDTDFIIPCHSGAKLNASSLRPDFEVQLWLPLSQLKFYDNNILALTSYFAKELNAKRVFPKNFKFELLFMYIKKLWYYGDDISKELLEEIKAIDDEHNDGSEIPDQLPNNDELVSEAEAKQKTFPLNKKGKKGKCKKC